MRGLCKNGGFPLFKRFIAGGAFLLISGCAGLNLAGIKAPYVMLSDFRLAQAGWLSQEYQVQLKVQNPNPFPLPLQGMEYSLDLNGQRFAQGVSPQVYLVPAFGEQRLDLRVSSNLAGIIRQIQDLKKGPKTFSYRLSGSFHLRPDTNTNSASSTDTTPWGGTLPFEYADEIQLKH